MGDENAHFRPENPPPAYGAVVPAVPINSAEDEITPLLDDMDDNGKIGISTQTLVSRTGPDAKPKRLTQYVAGLSVTLGAFALGTCLSWTSPAGKMLGISNETNPDNSTSYDFGFSDEQQSWIASAMALGAAVVVLPCGWAMDTFGRKTTMLGLVAPFVVGWLLILFAYPYFIANEAGQFWMLIIGRFITGMMGGAFSLSAPAYTSEIADKEVRGMLGGFFQLMLTIGILFCYILDAANANYYLLCALCAAIPVCFAIIFFFMPETPLYHLKKGRETAARKALQWFRGQEYDIEEELQEHKESVEKAERERVTFSQAFQTKAAKNGMFIACGLMLFQQLSGVNAVIFFAADIFESAGSSLESSISTVIIGVVQVVATFISSQIVDRLGRRLLLIVSDSIMCICTVLLGVFFYLQENGHKETADKIGWLPLVSLALFIVVFSLGFGPIPWTMVSELFPPNIKGVASSVAVILNWLLAFIVTKFFVNLQKGMGSGPTFWLFAAISAVGTVFVFFIVPETKGKSLEQIQVELGGGQFDVESTPPMKKK